MKNRKGYMLIELILASLIAFALAMYMASLTIKLKNKNDDLLVESLVTTDSAVATNSILKIINEDPNNFDCGLISVDKEKNTIKYNDEVVAVFSSYATLEEAFSYCTDVEMDESDQLHIGVDVPQIPDKDFSINIDFIKRKNPSSNVIFEARGSYDFAVAGSNSADRGDSYSTSYATCQWIYKPPTDSRFNNILNELKTKYNINSLDNITGSELNTNHGTITKVIFTYWASGSGAPRVDIKPFKGKILLIKPDFTYTFIPYDESHNVWTEFLDITDYIDKRNPDGMYYVSFIDASIFPQSSWSMTAIYEKDTLPYSYAKLVLNEARLANGQSAEIMFDSKYALKGTYQITGTIIAGGAGGWPVSEALTGDKVEAILDDGSRQQLYETTYKGKKIFEGRTDKDFAAGIYNTVRPDGYPKGGELDIFKETLDSDFFGGKELKGIKITKIGTNDIKVGLLGVSMAIEE